MDRKNHPNYQPKKAKICKAKMLTTAEGQNEESEGEDQKLSETKVDPELITLSAATTECAVPDNTDTSWHDLPEPILVRILWLLSIKDMVNVSGTCRRWYSIVNDDFLWKQKLQKHFKIDPSIDIKPGEILTSSHSTGI